MCLKRSRVASPNLLVWVAALVLFAGSGVAQPLPVRIYGASQPEQCWALTEAVDSGYCLAGWTRSYGNGTPAASNILVIKTSPSGTPQWARVSSGTNDDEAYSMVRTTDQGYVLTGWTRSYGPNIPSKNIFVTKLNSLGNVVWSRVYGGLNDDEAYSIIETFDGGFAVTGYTASFGPVPFPNIFVLRLDPLGNVLWLRVYWLAPHHVEDEAYSIIETPDSGFAVCGRAKITTPAQFDAFLLKLNPSGNVQWLSCVPGEDEDEAYSVAVDQQQNILVAGWTKSFGTNPLGFADLFVSRFTLGGICLWARTYGWSTADEKVLDDRSLVATSDGGSAVCGPTWSVGPGTPNNPNFLVLKLNANGGVIWCRSHPSPYDPGLLWDVPLPLIERAGGGYAVAGWTNSYPGLGGTDDFHFATFAANGNRPVCADPQSPDTDSLFWSRPYLEDTLCWPELDSMPLEPVVVGVDTVCDSTGPGPGVRGETPNPNRLPPLQLSCRLNRLELNLSQAGVVTVQLFSSDGRQLALLCHKYLTRGRHELPLPDNIGRGVALVCATSGGQTVTGRLIRF